MSELEDLILGFGAEEHPLAIARCQCRAEIGRVALDVDGHPCWVPSSGQRAPVIRPGIPLRNAGSKKSIRNRSALMAAIRSGAFTVEPIDLDAAPAVVHGWCPDHYLRTIDAAVLREKALTAKRVGECAAVVT